VINDRTVGIFTPRGGDKSCARNRDGALKIDVLQNARLDYYATPPKSESAPWIIRQGIIYDSIRPRTHVRTHTWPLIMPLDPHLDPQPRLISWAKHAAVSFSMETKAHCVTEESRSWESSRGFTVPWKALGDEIVYCVVNRKRKGGNCNRPTITSSSFAATSLIFVCTRARARASNDVWQTLISLSQSFIQSILGFTIMIRLVKWNWERVEQTRILDRTAASILCIFYLFCVILNIWFCF